MDFYSYNDMGGSNRYGSQNNGNYNNRSFGNGVNNSGERVNANYCNSGCNNDDFGNRGGNNTNYNGYSNGNCDGGFDNGNNNCNQNNFQNKFDEYSSMSEKQLYAELANVVDRMKREGTFDISALENLYATSSPYLNEAQRARMKSIIDMLK